MPLPTFGERLFAPVDIASIVVFRVAFGVLVLALVLYYVGNDAVAQLYLEPPFLFKFKWFEWVVPWPGRWLEVHFQTLGVLGAFIALGLLYRPAVVLFGLGFTYVFLLERGRYLNHFYLVCLLSLLLAFVPAHRAFSIDARWRKGLRASTVPAWSLWILRAQIGVVYAYAGLAKLNGDWIAGEPMRSWLAARTHYPLIGPLFGAEWMVMLFAWGGLLFDLGIVPALLWRRTRPIAFAIAVAFHLTNAWQFRIDIFPWLMIAATTLFFAPDWPRRLLRPPARPKTLDTHESKTLDTHAPTTVDTHASAAPTARRRRLIVGVLGVYLAVQLLLPLRHVLYPGPALWTEEGSLFAWRMLLKLKRPGYHFRVSDEATARAWIVDPARFLTPEEVGQLVTRPDLLRQYRQELRDQFGRNGVPDVDVQLVRDPVRFRVTVPATGETWVVDPVEAGLRRDVAMRMSTTPDMILQYARHLARRAMDEGHAVVEVRAVGVVSLHGRPYQPLVDPQADLASARWTLGPSAWIVPLREALPKRIERLHGAGSPQIPGKKSPSLVPTP